MKMNILEAMGRGQSIAEGFAAPSLAAGLNSGNFFQCPTRSAHFGGGGQKIGQKRHFLSALGFFSEQNKQKKLHHKPHFHLDTQSRRKFFSRSGGPPDRPPPSQG